MRITYDTQGSELFNSKNVWANLETHCNSS